MKKKILSAIIAFLVTFFFIESFVAIEKKQLGYEEQANRLAAMKTINGITDAMQRELDKCCEYTEFLDILISEDINISMDMLNEYADLILDRNGKIKNIQVAPDGIVKYIYPLKGDEEAIGHDLLNDPQRSPYVEAAIERRIPVIQGPVPALQGNLQVFCRKAIFIIEDGNEKFWGLSIVTLDFNELISKCGLSQNKDGYLFAFRAAKPDTRQDYLWGEYQIFNEDALIKTVDTGDQKWEVSILPEDGWHERQFYTAQMDRLFVFVTVVIFTLVFLYVSLNMKIYEDARLEPLTRTLNKKWFRKHVKKKLRQKHKVHGLILIDVNNLKRLNDNFGHQIGDAVIIEVTRRIRSALRRADRLSRFGGDEYSVFVYNAGDGETVDNVRKRILKSVNRQMMIDGLKLDVSVSAGHAVYPQDGTKFDELLRVSDQRMYANKEAFKREMDNAK